MKTLIIILMLLSLYGCEVAAKETGSSDSAERAYAPIAPISEETAIDRPYILVAKEEIITFTDVPLDLEIITIRHNPSGLPDYVMISTPAGMVSKSVTVKLRGVELTATVNGNVNEYTMFVASQNIGALLGPSITMNVTEDVLDTSNPNDFVAIYVNNVKVCYWYLYKF